MKSWNLVLAILACATVGFAGAPAAEAAGVSKRCGGPEKIRCDAGLWCDPSPSRCAIRRVPGRCVQVPQVCTMIYQPVCGCDGKTYSNDCVRRSQRVGKRHAGEC